MKILITGANGQLGQDCVKVLTKEHSLSPFSSRDLDISDNRQTASIIQRLRPDTVINCAAYTAVDNCEKDTERCRQVNGRGPGYLAAACAAIGARIIHISTDYVFDGSKPVPEPYDEEQRVNPVSQYGLSKLAGENSVRNETDNHLILRTAWLYGIGGKNFLKTMLRLALAKPRNTIRVVNDQFGSLTWTYSLAQQIQALLPTNLNGTLHATAEGYSSWYEGAKYFLECIDVPHRLEPCTTADYPTPAKRPTNSILENKVLKEHGLNIMPEWKEEIKSFVADHGAELLEEAETPAG